jgi:hypothetical protein
MTVLITDNKSYYSVYEPENKWIYSTFKGIVNYKIIMEHLQNGQIFSQNHEIHGALVDLRTLRGSYYKLFDYLENEVYPNLKVKGLHTQAFIISDDIIIAHVTGKLMEMFDRLNIKAEIFSGINQGRAWLHRHVHP